MKPWVKICGITNLDDAHCCADAGADALGFIFYQKSPRYVRPSEAAEIIQKLPDFITPVGVFVNESRDAIERIINETGLAAIQLSGDETPEDCLGYRLPVVKAFRIRSQNQLHLIKKYPIMTAMLDGAKNGMYGGSGLLPEFSIALEIKKIGRLILAGGLNPDNVLEAIKTVQPYGVDVSSGVEISPGNKDHAKVRLLFERIARLDQ